MTVQNRLKTATWKYSHKIKDRKAIAVINKCDLPIKIDKEYIRSNIEHTVCISADKGEGLDLLEEENTQSYRHSRI